MKIHIGLLFAMFTITVCKGQSNKALKDQQDVYKSLEDMKAKGLYPSTEGGWTMTALIDGKPWKATGVYSPALSSRITGVYKESKISMPDPARLTAGLKINFGEHNVVDFSPVDNPDFWGSRSGQMEITKVTGDWAEGKFSFTATMRGSNQKIEVTNGFFRISSKNQ